MTSSIASRVLEIQEAKKEKENNTQGRKRKVVETKEKEQTTKEKEEEEEEEVKDGVTLSFYRKRMEKNQVYTERPQTNNARKRKT